MASAWTVSPASVQLSVKPDHVTRGSFRVMSSDSVGRRFRVIAQDLGQDASGAFTFNKASRAMHSAASWIDIKPRTFEGSRRTQPIDFAIAVPANATPGDHVASISTQELPATLRGNIGVVQAIGLRITIRVPGATRSDAAITQFTSTKLTFGNGVPIHATVVNTGNTVLDFGGANTGSGITVGEQRIPITGVLLPGAKRFVQYGWNDPPLIGSRKAKLRVHLEPGRDLTSTTSTFAFPLFQTLGLLLLILAAYVLQRWRRRDRRLATTTSPLETSA
jgi:hypothetical protein